MGTLSSKLLEQLNIPGFAPNLFEVEFHFLNGLVDTSIDGTLYCTGYELPPPSMDVKQNPLTKSHYIEKYTIPEVVSITWQEDSSLRVWRYHQNWLNSIYDRGYDVFLTGKRGPNKKRQALIRIQQYPAGSGFTSDPQTSFEIILKGLIPKTIPAFRGEWNSDAERGSTGLTIQYFVDFIQIKGIEPVGTGTI